MFLFHFTLENVGIVSNYTLMIKDSFGHELKIPKALPLQNFKSNLTAMKQYTCNYKNDL